MCIRDSVWVDLVMPEGVDYSIITQEVVDALSHFQDRFPKPPLLPQYRSMAGLIATPHLGAHEMSPGSNNWVVSPFLSATGQVLLANDPHRGVTNPSLRYMVHLNAPGYSVIGSTEPSIPGVAIGHNGKVGWGLTIVGTDQADIFIERLNPQNHNQAMYQGQWYDLRTVVEEIPVRGESRPRRTELKFSRHGPIFHVDTQNLSLIHI